MSRAVWVACAVAAVVSPFAGLVGLLAWEARVRRRNQAHLLRKDGSRP